MDDANTMASIEGRWQEMRRARARRCWLGLALGVLVVLWSLPAIASADRYVYVSNGFPAGSNDVSALRINSDGSLTPVSGSPYSTGGTVTEGLTLTPDAQHLYVAEFGANNVVGFNVRSDGGLSTAPNSPYGPAPTALGVIPDPNGGHVFVWNHNNDTIGTWTVSSDGSLNQISGSPVPIPGGLHNPFAGSVAPDGRNVFVPNENSDPVAGISTDKVTAYDTGSNGSLGAHQNIASGNPSAGGSNPFGSGITPNGEFFYTSNPEDGPNGTLDGYEVSNGGGFLTELSGFPKSVAPGNHPLNIAISPDGQHLYVATRISNSVNAYNIGSDGSLTSIPGSPFATDGTNGKALAFTPDGKRLYVSNNGSDNITGFNVASDGSLTLIPGSPWPTGGTDPDLESIAITPNQPPTAAFSVKSKPKKKSAKFDGSSSTDSDGTVATYAWDFGDGTTKQTSSPATRHKYAQPGRYLVTLTDTDNEGCSIDRIFTGKATICNGSAAAQTDLHVIARKLTIKFKNRKQKFKGKLKAKKKLCRHDTVKVFRKRKHGNDQIIGTDNTNPAGKWSVKAEGAHGRFYVQVKQKTQPSGAPCLATKSKATKVG
jgi:6-phosphogluconolactonase (cycloisomerase 2 family)